MHKVMYSLVLLACTFNGVSLDRVSGQERQERKGTITGRVTDSGHDVLPGARVELQPKGRTVASDTQGQFTISDLAPGEYKITISYVGFSPFSTGGTVAGGEAARVDAVLQVQTGSEEMIVKAERPRGEARAVNLERTAHNIL